MKWPGWAIFLVSKPVKTTTKEVDVPFFRLNPRPDTFDSDDWETSRYRGSCVVTARNARLARTYACSEFGLPHYVDARGQLRMNPWGQPEKVVCLDLGDLSAESPPQGMVIKLS
jgi:hypothetical protein